MQELEKEGHVDVFYGDESGFCLTSAIPYGWQFPGEHVATQPRHGPRFNVLGFYNATNELHTTAREGTLDAAFVIDTLDAWAATRTRPTVLVLDNAKIHHAAAFRARLEAWQAQDVYIFYLPTYSPTSIKFRRSGAKSRTNGSGPKPTPRSKHSKPPSGTSSTA